MFFKKEKINNMTFIKAINQNTAFTKISAKHVSDIPCIITTPTLFNSFSCKGIWGRGCGDNFDVENKLIS